MPAPENILLIRLKSIGDILLTLPAIHAVRENFPDAKLHFLVSKENAQLLRGFADVDEIISLDRATFRSTHPISFCSNAFKLVRDLRQRKFSRVIDFQGYGETAWLSWLSGAPECWGSVYKKKRAWAYTCGVPRNQKIHPADWNLSLLQQCGLKIGNIRNQFILPTESLAEAKQFFENNNLDESKPTLYLQPFTSNPKKNWPLEKYLALADFWRERKVQIIFSGGPGDKAQLELARTKKSVVAAGVPRMTDAGLIKLSTLIIGGDTGFLHLAVAMEKRALMLIKRKGPGAPVPFQHPDWIAEPSIGLAVKDIEFEKVLTASAVAFKECRVTF
jgi:ADP-heptose:LPS heptosyltransferase